ncbi:MULTISPECIES: hypothetical protein [unclassified Stenotrophomonas]|uniref:hypothetical protein n=1 Tax=unclassified Stenotrophomonas TaxID=196198 RepID=UPI0025DAE5BF|nr:MULTISPECIES: hypothetical protein [unclassified Stenotrophomonas]
MSFQTAYQLHGSGAEFWETYQTLLRLVTTRTGDHANVANELASLAVQIGATDEALFV